MAIVKGSRRGIHSNIQCDANDEADSRDLTPITADPPPHVVEVDAQIRWIHFILGCSVLLPWNAMITATPFFLSRLAGSPFESTFSSYLSTTFTASRFIFLARATAISRRTSPSRQIRGCIFWLSILTLVLTISTFLKLAPGLFFVFILVIGVAQAALDSHLQTSVVAVASLFGSQAVQAVMSGQAAVATAVSAVQQASARVFFALSTFFLVISALAHSMLVEKPIYKAVVAPLEHALVRDMGNADERRLLASSTGQIDFISEKARILRVAKTNIIYELAAAYVFIVTLVLLPTNPGTHPLLFNMIHFLVFNVGDFLGRYICAFPRLLIWSANWLLTLSLARTFFILLFLMCNIQRPSSGLSTPPIINSDILFMLILFAFGLSNGYVSSLCMMSAPSLVHNPRLKGRKDDVDVAATVANFSIAGGLAIGSVASFAVRAAICGCNPFSS
ncbi:nucleoside transporter-domain-containing protein [Lyophyllum atratum]|nr:nucleoside transporter-domain-containing protein [Lyophyllum atratum]